MKKMNKKYLIYWVNIILLMLNTALLVFFCFTPEKTIYKNEDSTISNEFLRKELDFTDEQYKLINELDKDVLRRHQTVLKLLCQRRYQMLNELAKPNPSTEELNKIATSVGHLHKALKTQTARHLLNIKKVCTPEQSKKLEKCSSIYWRLTNIVRNVQKNVRIKKNAKDVISSTITRT